MNHLHSSFLHAKAVHTKMVRMYLFFVQSNGTYDLIPVVVHVLIFHFTCKLAVGELLTIYAWNSTFEMPSSNLSEMFTTSIESATCYLLCQEGVQRGACAVRPSSSNAPIPIGQENIFKVVVLGCLKDSKMLL